MYSRYVQSSLILCTTSTTDYFSITKLLIDAVLFSILPPPPLFAMPSCLAIAPTNTKTRTGSYTFHFIWPFIVFSYLTKLHHHCNQANLQYQNLCIYLGPESRIKTRSNSLHTLASGKRTILYRTVQDSFLSFSKLYSIYMEMQPSNDYNLFY